MGLRGIPVVTRGGHHVLGIEGDFEKLDRLLGISKTSVVRALNGQELVERACRIVGSAMRYARQLPREAYDFPFPGMENARPPFMQGDHVVVDEEGVPFVPHGTHIGLVRHIVCHITKFRHEAQNPGADYTNWGLYAQLGEPSQRMMLDELEERVSATILSIQRWWEQARDEDLNVEIRTFSGQETLRKMLQREVYSLAQHTRQLMALLRKLGIEPDGPIGEKEYEGLYLPDELWT